MEQTCFWDTIGWLNMIQKWAGKKARYNLQDTHVLIFMPDETSGY